MNSPYPHRYSALEIDKVPTRDYCFHPGDPGTVLPVRRSWRRLADVDYRHPDCLCLVTACSRDRRRVFTDPRAARLAADAVLEQHRRVGHRLFAYVIMPNHAHVVLAPGASGLSIGQIIGRWKSFVSNEGRKRRLFVRPWQRDYDDRVRNLSRNSYDRVERMIAYVLENPVRQGLARTWQEYPYCGRLIPPAEP